MDTKAALTMARDMIARPGTWQRFFIARSSDDQEVSPLDSAACRWCAYGAIAAAAGDDFQLRNAAVRHLARVIDPDLKVDDFGVLTVFSFNDAHQHQEVIRKFEEAIECL